MRVRTAISSISAAGLDVTVVSDDDLAGLDEFGLLHENAETDRGEWAAAVGAARRVRSDQRDQMG